MNGCRLCPIRVGRRWKRLLDDGEGVAAAYCGALGDREFFYFAAAVGGDLVLHLHRLDYADQVALADLGALLDGDFEDGALEGRRQGLAGGAAAAAAFALAFGGFLPAR